MSVVVIVIVMVMVWYICRPGGQPKACKTVRSLSRYHALLVLERSRDSGGSS